LLFFGLIIWTLKRLLISKTFSILIPYITWHLFKIIWSFNYRVHLYQGMNV
jgi:hypothetical protein